MYYKYHTILRTKATFVIKNSDYRDYGYCFTHRTE